MIRAADDILEQQTLYPFGQYAFGSTNSSVAGYTGDDVDFTGHHLRGGQINRLHAMHDMQARYYVSGLAMFGGVDPSTHNYPAVSSYSYCVNDPINFLDLDGEDVIPIVFPDYEISVGGRKIKGLGHAGVLLIDNATGLTKYYEYGRYDAKGHGIVRNKTIPNVVMGANGQPTPKSLAKVLKAISSKSGHNGRIQAAYIKSDNFGEMRSYAESRMAENTDSKRKPYSIASNNCGTFMCEVAGQDPSVSSQMPWMLDPRPNSVIEELRDSFSSLDWNPGDTEVSPVHPPTQEPETEEESEPEPEPDTEPDPRRA